MPKLIFDRAEQLLKAYPPTFFNVLGSVTSVIVVEPLNALKPSDMTFLPSKVDGIVILPDKSAIFVQVSSSISFESFNSYSQFAVTPLIVDVAVYLSFANTFPLNLS